MREQLDSRSGLTFVTGTELIVFARTEMRYSRSGRDYVYLGPLEINQRGAKEYLLWVGIASTLDRGFLAPDKASPTVLYARVRGEVMEFKLRPLSDHLPALEEAPRFKTAVRLRDQLAARVTLDQLTLLSAEGLELIRVATEDNRPEDYVRWEEGSSWNNFLSYTSGLNVTGRQSIGE